MAQSTCSVPTDPPCPDPVVARGYCNKHWKRWKAHGDPLFTKQIRGDDEARFWSWVDKRGDEECWLWIGKLNHAGYGVFTMRSKSVSAHRWAFERFVGPIPDGYQIDHVKANGCTNRHCVNFLHHLEAVTPRENTLRSDGITAFYARQTHCSKNHEYTPENTYQVGNHRHCRQCARDKALAWFRANKAKNRAA